MRINRLLSLAITGIFVASLYCNAAKTTFNDTDKGFWAYPFIKGMVEKGAISGYPNGSFMPDKEVTRAEFAKIMAIAANIGDTGMTSGYFVDVPNESWFYTYVEKGKMYLMGFEKLDGAMEFRPNDFAIREDVTIALVKLKGLSCTWGRGDDLLRKFIDCNSISDYSKQYIDVAVKNKLISGYPDETFRPRGTVTRAETAVLLWRAVEGDKLPGGAYQEMYEKLTGQNQKEVDKENVTIEDFINYQEMKEKEYDDGLRKTTEDKVAGTEEMQTQEEYDGQVQVVKIEKDNEPDVDFNQAESSLMTKISIYVNNEKIALSSEPEEIGGEILVDVADVINNTGTDYTFDKNIGRLTLKNHEGNTVNMEVCKPSIWTNGKETKLKCSPVIKEGRMKIPPIITSLSLGYGYKQGSSFGGSFHSIQTLETVTLCKKE